MELDTKTGLPVLPEDHFWRVVDRKGTEGRHHNQLEVHLMEIVRTTKKKSVWKSVGRPWTNLWFEKFEQVEVDVESYKEVLLLKENLVTKRRVSSDVLQQYLDYGWTQDYSRSEFWGGGYDIEDDTDDDLVDILLLLEPTEANVLTAAEAVFEKFVSLQEKKLADEWDSAERAKLVGDYPPKVLGDGLISGVVRVEGDS